MLTCYSVCWQVSLAHQNMFRHIYTHVAPISMMFVTHLSSEKQVQTNYEKCLGADKHLRVHTCKQSLLFLLTKLVEMFQAVFFYFWHD